MRSLASILLLTVLLLPFWGPVLAGGQGGDAGLPACCRRSGKHHCAMTMAEKSQLSAASDAADPQWKAPMERCPYCPAAAASWHREVRFAAPPAQAIFAELVSHPAGSVQTESKWRISRDRSRQKRGPPAVSLA